MARIERKRIIKTKPGEIFIWDEKFWMRIEIPFWKAFASSGRRDCASVLLTTGKTKFIPWDEEVKVLHGKEAKLILLDVLPY